MRPFRYGLDLPLERRALRAEPPLRRAALGQCRAVFTNHFGDLLLIPCALPVLLGLQQLARLRTHDLPPMPGEIAGTLALWAVLFEVVFPLAGRGVSDPRDVLAYATSALLAHFAWAFHHRIPISSHA